LYIPDILTHLWLNEILQNEGEGEKWNTHSITSEILAQVALMFVDVHIVKVYISVYIMVCYMVYITVYTMVYTVIYTMQYTMIYTVIYTFVYT